MNTTPPTLSKQTREPGAGKTYRVNISLPPELAIQLRETAEAMGVSQAALVVSLIQDAIPTLHRLTRKKDPDAETVKRFRGESIDLILSQVGKILKKI